MEDQLAMLRAERLQGITPETLDRLNRFSHGRLLFFHLPMLFVEDLPQEAIQDILLRERKPTADQLATAEAFESYIRSIISSKAEAMSRRLRFEELPERDTMAMATPTPSPAQAAHQSDLKETFFKLLKKQVAPSDCPTVDEWHEIFDHTDRIPVVNGKRKSTWRIRNLARKIATRLKLVSISQP
jgi:hypothetical protein